MDELNWPLMLGAGIIASASPGPATLGIAGTSMRHGRRAGLSLSAGIMAGSYIWSATAAFGVGAILLAHVWVLETVRYCGGAYLIWLAARSLRSAMVPGAGEMANMPAPRGHFMAGLALHITSPKPILFFGTLFSIGVPAGTGAGELALVRGRFRRPVRDRGPADPDHAADTIDNSRQRPYPCRPHHLPIFVKNRI